MKTSFLGSTDIEISKVGFGTWGIGGKTAGLTSYGETDDLVSCKALEHALAKGVTFFDTSPAYGDGHSEELLGKVFSGAKRNKIIIATKGGCSSFTKPFDFSVSTLQKGVEDSLRRLKTDYIDLFQLHNPSIERMENSDDLKRMLEDLKQTGKIRAFGVSIKDPNEGFIALSSLSPDALQVNFNLLDQRAHDCDLFEAALKKKTSIIARTPLCFGFLSGDITKETIFPDGDHRARWSRPQVLRWIEGGQEMAELLESISGKPVAEQALRFNLSFPEVATTIPGMHNVNEVEENIIAGLGDIFSQSSLLKIRTLYQKQSYFVKDQVKA